MMRSNEGGAQGGGFNGPWICGPLYSYPRTGDIDPMESIQGVQSPPYNLYTLLTKCNEAFTLECMHRGSQQLHVTVYSPGGAVR